jgi:hypothetical protein
MSTNLWRYSLYTRANGDVIGGPEKNIPLPFNISTIIKSVGFMGGPGKSQSCMWVGPRLLLSTLHLFNWPAIHPTIEDCENVRKHKIAFSVEIEVSAKILCEYSPRVLLVAFNVDHDLGIFKLQDEYPDRQDFIDVNWLMERDEAYHQGVAPESKAACIGFSSHVPENEAKLIKEQAAYKLSQHMPSAYHPVSCYWI